MYILDMVLTNNEHLISEISVHPNSFNSDHIPVSFVIKANSCQPSPVSRMVYCYKDVDFGGLQLSLQNIEWDTVLSNKNINENLDKLSINLWNSQSVDSTELCLRVQSKISHILLTTGTCTTTLSKKET